MVRRKEEFSLKFTDSLLLADGTFTMSSSLVNDIFNDPEAWSDASSNSAEEEREKFPQSAIASSRQAEFLKPFTANVTKRRRRVSLSSMSSPESASAVKFQRMSVMFSPPSDCSPVTPEDPIQAARTPLSVATASPNTAGITSPIAVSASATWSFLEWLGPDTPQTSKLAEWEISTIPPVPKLPPNTGSIQMSSPRKSALLVVPKVPPTPTKFVTAKRRPLPTVPTPSTASPRTANTSSPLAITSPPPPPPRGARMRSPSPSLTITVGGVQATSGQGLTPASTREPQYAPSVQKWVRSLPAPHTAAASAVPRERVPIAWLAS